MGAVLPTPCCTSSSQRPGGCWGLPAPHPLGVYQPTQTHTDTRENPDQYTWTLCCLLFCCHHRQEPHHENRNAAVGGDQPLIFPVPWSPHLQWADNSTNPQGDGEAAQAACMRKGS